MIEQGQTAPDFTLADQDGNDVSLNDYRGQTVVREPKGHRTALSTTRYRDHPRQPGQRPRRRLVR
jgi:hypothetical protein